MEWDGWARVWSYWQQCHSRGVRRLVSGCLFVLTSPPPPPSHVSRVLPVLGFLVIGSQHFEPYERKIAENEYSTTPYATAGWKQDALAQTMAEVPQFLRDMTDLGRTLPPSFQADPTTLKDTMRGAGATRGSAGFGATTNTMRSTMRSTGGASLFGQTGGISGIAQEGGKWLGEVCGARVCGCAGVRVVSGVHDGKVIGLADGLVPCMNSCSWMCESALSSVTRNSSARCNSRMPAAGTAWTWKWTRPRQRSRSCL